MSSLAIRLQEIDDSELEQFIELWIERRSKEYVRVERIGAANDKGRDVIGFLTDRSHEGDWHLFQCKRKTRDGKLGTPEAMTELGKLFHHHVEGAYRTLPVSYVFVAPRGIVGPLRDLILNPSTIAPRLIANWKDCCETRITAKAVTPLTPEILAAINGFDFSRVTYLSATLIVKDPHAGPALSKVLGLVPDEAPPGVVPDDIQSEEIRYLEQLRQVYGEAAGVEFATLDDVLTNATHGDHLRRQRTRFFEAASFERFHRDNTAPGALEAFREDIYHGVAEEFAESHDSRLKRVDAVMKCAGQLPAAILGRMSKIMVRQGLCHHLASEGRLPWNQ